MNGGRIFCSSVTRLEVKGLSAALALTAEVLAAALLHCLAAGRYCWRLAIRSLAHELTSMPLARLRQTAGL